MFIDGGRDEYIFQLFLREARWNRVRVITIINTINGCGTYLHCTLLENLIEFLKSQQFICDVSNERLFLLNIQVSVVIDFFLTQTKCPPVYAVS